MTDVVVLRALGLGDLLTAVPALRALRRGLPRARITLAAPAALAPLAHASGAVDAVADTSGLGPLPSHLRGPGLAVNLHGRGPRSHRLLGALAPARLIAFASTSAGVSGPQWRAEEHEVARWCRLLAESGVPADPAELRITPPPGPSDPDWRDATVIHPGAASAARRWPPERFAAVARHESAAGRRVIVTGSAAERALAEEVARRAGLPRGSVLAGRLDLAALSRLVADAGRVVCGDTGVAHLATAVGAPSVVIFGPTPPALWGPPPDGPHLVLWAGRRGDPHAAAPGPGLLAISAADVRAALGRLEETVVSIPPESRVRQGWMHGSRPSTDQGAS